MARTFSPTGVTLRSCSCLSSSIPRVSALLPRVQHSSHLPATWLMLLLQVSSRKNDIFNILWVLVFGFATLNILSLVARRFEPQRNRLSFGETLAIGVVLMSMVLLGWELLTLFKVFPLKLHPRY